MARYQKVINLIEEIAHDEGIDMDQFDAASEKIAAEVKAFPNMNREQRACWQEVELWKRTCKYLCTCLYYCPCTNSCSWL